VQQAGYRFTRDMVAAGFAIAYVRSINGRVITSWAIEFSRFNLHTFHRRFRLIVGMIFVDDQVIIFELPLDPYERLLAVHIYILKGYCFNF
jgi:hypothetical protein